ncbi:hypothetical protein [Oceanirhabdus sp. W0125-5]|uniref:hypothetical protein n=1 Tax=Oceanirhabdus sp. W0125-5 TaxID=2999116 RepID=UPI0022F2E6FA|nr:hypothetical protein [Oceanirhabdus sp. W0125-5]WBW97100.1 hypothetical protein OW730_25930 [Oceanirhabdus sp. W0125-5]
MKESNKENRSKEGAENQELNDYGLRSINGNGIKESSKDFRKFGVISAKNAIEILFYLGIFPILMKAIAYGKVMYLSHMYEKEISFIENGMRHYTYRMVNNLPLGIFTGILYFVFGVLIWKIICELLIMIFRCFETYVEKNKKR